MKGVIAIPATATLLLIEGKKKGKAFTFLLTFYYFFYLLFTYFYFLLNFMHILTYRISPATTKGVIAIPATATLLLIEGKKDVEKIFHFLLSYQTKLEEEEEKKEKERLEKTKGTPGKKNIKLLGGKFKPEAAAPPTRKMLRDVPVLYLFFYIKKLN
jgi:hypothetical protein